MKRIVLFAFCIALMLCTPLTAIAAPQHGFGRGEGRTDSVNINDFHTAAWERFWFNYEFSSGMEYRYDLGSPTTYSGFVPVDVYSVNMRRDANASLVPPSYGVFSGFVPTNQSNLLFPPVTDPAFYSALLLENPNFQPSFDTLQAGVNAIPIDNPLNVQGVSGGGFLPPTSIQ